MLELLPSPSAPVLETPPSLEARLMEAVQAGEVSRLRRLLRRGADADLRLNTGFTLLGWAAVHRRPAVVQVLLDAGAHPDRPGPDECSPLHEAAHRGDGSIVSRLLAAYAWVDAPDVRGDTPLHYAVEAARPVVVVQLLRHGAAADRPDSAGRTPLTLAAARGHARLVRLLLARVAAVDRPDERGDTALLVAAGGGHAAALDLLLAAGADPDQADQDGATALMRAAAQGSARCTARLLAASADATRRDAAGRTARDYAEPWLGLDLAEQLWSQAGAEGAFSTPGRVRVRRRRNREGENVVRVEARHRVTGRVLQTWSRCDHFEEVVRLLDARRDEGEVAARSPRCSGPEVAAFSPYAYDTMPAMTMQDLNQEFRAWLAASAAVAAEAGGTSHPVEPGSRWADTPHPPVDFGYHNACCRFRPSYGFVSYAYDPDATTQEADPGGLALQYDDGCTLFEKETVTETQATPNPFFFTYDGQAPGPAARTVAEGRATILRSGTTNDGGVLLETEEA